MPASKSILLGLIGHPVSHSVSPLLHEAALSYHGLDGEYRLNDISPKDLNTTFAELKNVGYAGINVTIPHKQAVMPLLDELADQSNQVGAVNTIVFANGQTKGYNTDIFGFSKSLEEALEHERVDREWSKSVLVIGCGGAARAVVAGLCDMGLLDISVYGRDASKAREFVGSLAKSFGHKGELLLQGNLLRAVDKLDEETLATKFLVINATPLGQDGNALPDWLVDCIGKLDRRAFVYDLVYSKTDKPTAVEELSRTKGIASTDGLDMLIYQAACAFEIWTGLSVPVQVMRNAIESRGQRKD